MAAQPHTHRTGPVRIVKRKHARCDFRQTDTAVHTGKVFAEHQQLTINHLYIDNAVPQFQGCFQGICQPLVHAFPYHQTVHHYFNGMFFIFFQIDIIVNVENFPIDTHTDIALMTDMVESFAMLALLAPYYLCHNQQFSTLRQFLYLVHHLVHGLLGNGLAAFRTVRPSGPGKKQAQVIVNLRHRPDRRTGIMTGGLLVNGDCRGQPVNIIHVRLIHLPQKLPGIRGQGFHITPLPFRVHSIKGQR